MESSLFEARRNTKPARAGRALLLAVAVLAMVVELSACSPGGMFDKATETPTATLTLPPTNTPEPTATPVLPTSTLAPTPTPEPIIVHESISPDSRWIARTSRVFVDGEERSIFVVTSNEGDVQWEVENEPFVERPPESFWFPEPFYWSIDGNYLYYVRRASGDGCFGSIEHGGKDLKKFNLVTGEVSDVSSGGRNLSFSPDEKFLAVVPYGGDGIQIQDLERGEVKESEFPVRGEDVGIEVVPGYLTWSPDKRSLLYVLMAGICSGEGESQFNWIIRLDVQTSSQKVLIERDQHGLVPVSWMEVGKVELNDRDGKLWYMDPNTGKISAVVL